MSDNPYAECGMTTKIGEYHPHAACLMFKACNNADEVRANLNGVCFHAEREGQKASTDERAEMQAAIVELREFLKNEREQSLNNSGFPTPLTERINQVLNNTKKWSEHE